MAATLSQWLQTPINDGSVLPSVSMGCDGVAVPGNTSGHRDLPGLHHSFGSLGSATWSWSIINNHLIYLTLYLLLPSYLTYLFLYSVLPFLLATALAPPADPLQSAMGVGSSPTVSSVKKATKKSLSSSATSSPSPFVPFIPLSSAFPLISYLPLWL